MKPTKEQMQEWEKKLLAPWGQLDLMCDGRKVSLQVQRWKGMSYRVMTYVDGSFNGEWMLEKNAAPEAKFLRKSVRAFIKPSEKKKAEKELGKRFVKNSKFWNATFVTFMPDWPSGKAAISHLVKVCDSVTLAVDAAADESAVQTA